MLFFKNIFARLCALWALLTFVISFLIFLIPSLFTNFIADPKGTAIFIKIARLWMRVWLTITGCRLQVNGTKNFKKGEQYIVTCNHNSFLDIPLSCPFIPGANKTIAKKSFAKIPLFGWYYSKGSVLVDRNDESSRKKSFREMKAVLDTGMHMSVYPEGTRNRTGQPLKTFHSGAFRLATESGKDVIPAVIFNTARVLPSTKAFYFMPGKIAIHFLPPVTSSNKTPKALQQEVFDIMWKYYVSNQ